MDAEYLRASNGEGEPLKAVIVEDRDAGNLLINVDTVLNWPAKFIATSGSLVNDELDPTSTVVFYGSLSGSMVHIDSFAPGYTDKGSLEGQVVLIKPTTAWADEVAEGLQTNADNITANTATIGTKYDKTGGEISGSVGIGKIPENGALDVEGDIYSNGEKVGTKIKVGVIAGSHFGTAGSRTIPISFGFTPKSIRFSVLASNNINLANLGIGVVDKDLSQWSTAVAISSSGAGRQSSTTAAILALNFNDNQYVRAEVTAISSTGITVNVTTANSGYDFGYEATG